MYSDLKKLLLTYGILSIMTEDQREIVREKFDTEKIEAELASIGAGFRGVTDEFTTGMVMNILADEFPEAYRSSEPPQNA